MSGPETELEQIAARALDAALSAGAGDAEAYVEDSTAPSCTRIWRPDSSTQ